MIGPHVVPPEVFTALAAGGGGAAGVRFLARGQRSKHLLLLRRVVAEAERIRHDQAAELAAAYDLLAQLQMDHPAATEPVLRHPPVATWALRMPAALHRGGPPAAFAYLPSMAAAAAVRAGADCKLELPAPAGRVRLPTLGEARLMGAGRRSTVRARLLSDRDGAEITGSGARVAVSEAGGGWWELRRIDARAGGRRLILAVEDLDPYRLPYAIQHGIAAGRQNRREVERWRGLLERGWALLVTGHPGPADELSEAITILVPVRTHRGARVSSTMRHAFGQVALAPPPDARSLACALAHELQHAKLSALMDLVPMLRQHSPSGLYAPWRDDPRPPPGLLQGAYAHLAVAAFWRERRLLDEGEEAMRGHAEYARWRRDTAKAVSALRASGALTEAGREFVERMAEVLDSWNADAVPPVATNRAQALSDRHRREWLRRHAR